MGMVAAAVAMTSACIGDRRKAHSSSPSRPSSPLPPPSAVASFVRLARGAKLLERRESGRFFVIMCDIDSGAAGRRDARAFDGGWETTATGRARDERGGAGGRPSLTGSHRRAAHRVHAGGGRGREEKKKQPLQQQHSSGRVGQQTRQAGRPTSERNTTGRGNTAFDAVVVVVIFARENTIIIRSLEYRALHRVAFYRLPSDGRTDVAHTSTTIYRR
ncbi:hypothetical protein Trydic_g17272 [Trypoxylus dichotomus]